METKLDAPSTPLIFQVTLKSRLLFLDENEDKLLKKVIMDLYKINPLTRKIIGYDGLPKQPTIWCDAERDLQVVSCGYPEHVLILCVIQDHTRLWKSFQNGQKI